MKRRIFNVLIFLLTFLMSASMLTACKNGGQAKAEIVSKTDTMVVIKVNEADEFATLIDAMTYLKDNEELTFEIAGGMITSIEGKENPTDWSACWMLYTSDSEMANVEWGTVVFDGNTYGSAILGANELSVTAGQYYVWSYDTF